MGILGFGKAKKLEDLKVTDLRKERLVQEVQQDQLVTKIRRAQDEHDGLLDAASEPGLSDAEVDVAAYKMDLVAKRRDCRSSAKVGHLRGVQDWEMAMQPALERSGPPQHSS